MRKNSWYYFNKAAKRAAKGSKRNYRLAALGIREDGTEVYCPNGNPQYPTLYSHAEKRLCRKLDKGASVYVVRVGANGNYRMARPCARCQYVMRKRKVKRVFYTISENEYGVIEL